MQIYKMISCHIKKMKKILFLSPLPPPFYGSAISSKTCLNILKKEKDFRVTNIKINIAEEIEDIGRMGKNKFMGIYHKIKEIKEKSKKSKIDLLYFVPATSKTGIYKDFIFAMIAKKYCKNTLFHIRSRITEKDKKNMIKKIIYKKMFKDSKVIILDRLLKEDISNFFREEDIFVLENAIENTVTKEEFKKILQKRKKEKKLKILFISNMYESKGYYLLLKACKILKREKIKFECKFAGSWPSQEEKKKFEKFIKKNKLEGSIKYLGKKTGEEKRKIFEESDVLVFPTYYELEAHPRVIIEAMMFGLAVITTDHAANSNTIKNKETGFILEDISELDIAKYLKLANKERDKIAKVGENGRKRFLEKYEIKNYEKKFLNIIKKQIKD